MTKINFEKLNEIPYMKNFSENEKFQNWVDEYINFWSMQTPEALDSVALIRVIECTNGCVQYAYRDNKEWALDLDKTRMCMKKSMSFIKTKKLELPNGKVIECDSSITDALDEVRDIYIDGFKNNIPERLMQFYAQSVAQFYVLGKDRLDKYLDFVYDNFLDLFGDFFLNAGKKYIMSYLNAIEI